MNDVVVLTAAAVVVSLFGVAVSVGRLVRKIKAERKLVKKLGEPERLVVIELSSNGDLDRVKKAIEEVVKAELTPSDQKEVLGALEQRSSEGRKYYITKLLGQAKKVAKRTPA